MRKYVAILMCAGLLLTATGCGDEKKEDEASKKEDTKVEEKAKNKVKLLTCSQSYKDEMLMDTIFVYDIEGKEISKATVNYTNKLQEGDAEKVTDEDVDAFCEKFKDAVPVKQCDAKIDGNSVVAGLEYDIDKLDEEKDGFTKNTPIDELKEYMEKLNDVTTCKIEEKMIFIE